MCVHMVCVFGWGLGLNTPMFETDTYLCVTKRREDYLEFLTCM